MVSDEYQAILAARGDVVAALARERGLPNVMWAGPEKISRAMERGEVSVQGSPRQGASRVRLGFGSAQFGYLIELGMPTPLARLIASATQHSQVWVISHSRELVRRLEMAEDCTNHILEKSLGRTVIAGLTDLDKPPWR